MAMVKRRYNVPAYRRPSTFKYAPLALRAGRMIGQAYKRYRSSQSQSGSNKRQKSSTTGGISDVTTYQHDVKQTYRRKRLSKAQRTRGKRARRNYVAQTLRALQSRKYHYNGTMNWSSGVGSQAFQGWVNYGAFGKGGVDGTGDMQDILTRLNMETSLQGTAAQIAMGNAGLNSRKYFFDTMSSRVVLTNTGTSQVFWEVYECVARKDLSLNGRTTTGLTFTLEQYFDTLQDTSFQGTLTAGKGGDAYTNTQTSAAAAPTRYQPGITPFQLRRFCQDWKILKSTRFQCSPGNTVAFKANDTRNRTVVYDDWKDLAAKAGVTKMYLVRMWGAMTDAATGNAASSCTCEVEKDYNVKVMDQFSAECNYIKYTNNAET